MERQTDQRSDQSLRYHGLSGEEIGVLGMALLTYEKERGRYMGELEKAILQRLRARFPA